MFNSSILYKNICLEIQIINEQIKLIENGLLLRSVELEGLKRLLKKRLKQKSVIESLITQSKELPRKIAYMRLVDGKSLKDIAIELEYSYDHIRTVGSKINKMVKNVI